MQYVFLVFTLIAWFIGGIELLSNAASLTQMNVIVVCLCGLVGAVYLVGATLYTALLSIQKALTGSTPSAMPFDV